MTLKICPGCNSKFDGAHYQVVCSTCYTRVRETGRCAVCNMGKAESRVICKSCAQHWGGTKKGDSTRCNSLNVKGTPCKNWAMIGSYYCKQHQK